MTLCASRECKACHIHALDICPLQLLLTQTTAAFARIPSPVCTQQRTHQRTSTPQTIVNSCLFMQTLVQQHRPTVITPTGSVTSCLTYNISAALAIMATCVGGYPGDRNLARNQKAGNQYSPGGLSPHTVLSEKSAFSVGMARAAVCCTQLQTGRGLLWLRLTQNCRNMIRTCTMSLS